MPQPGADGALVVERTRGQIVANHAALPAAKEQADQRRSVSSERRAALTGCGQRARRPRGSTVSTAVESLLEAAPDALDFSRLARPRRRTRAGRG